MIPTINKKPDISILTAVTVGSLSPAYTVIFRRRDQTMTTMFLIKHFNSESNIPYTVLLSVGYIICESNSIYIIKGTDGIPLRHYNRIPSHTVHGSRFTRYIKLCHPILVCGGVIAERKIR